MGAPPRLVHRRALSRLIGPCLLGLLAVWAAAGRAQEPPPASLLLPIPAFQATALEAPQRDGTRRRRWVRVTPEALDARRLWLDLFPDRSLIASRVDAAAVAPGMRAWTGHVPGDPFGSVALVATGILVQGSIRLHDAAYSIEPLGTDGLHEVREVDLSALPPELPPRVPPPMPAASRSAPELTDAFDDHSTLDLLVVYTAAARDTAGSDAAVRARIALGVAETNLAYANSGVTQRLRLVGAELVGYAETGDLAWDLERLTAAADGHLDVVHARRAATGADLVQLVVGSPFANACGVAWMMQDVSVNFAPLAFSVTAYRCISPNYTFGHELGHNMGSAHAPEDYNVAPPFPYGYGYKDPAARFRTVMAYDCPSGCPRVLHFSNPDVGYDGDPTGTPDRHHNARSLDNTRTTVAAFRHAREMSAILGAPTGLSAQVAGTAVALAWSPPVEGIPSAYLLEVGTREGLADVATLSVGLRTAVTLSGVRPGQYFVRVRGADVFGPGAPSTTARVVIGPSAPCVPAAPPALLPPDVNGSRVALSWLAPTSGGPVERYVIGVGSTAETLDVAVIETSSTTPLFETLAANATYFVRIAGRNACGVGLPSNVEIVAVEATVPGPPSHLAAAVGKFGRVSLTWRAPAIGAAPTAYVVEAGSRPGASDVAVIPTGSALPSFTTSAGPATYYVRVRGVAAGGAGGPSQEVVVRVR